jgi:carboxypeptidase family protein
MPALPVIDYDSHMRHAVVLAALVAAFSATSASAAPSGLRGLVLRGPTTPVCRAELPCAAPVKGATLRFIRAGSTHISKTDAHGRYRIALAPGTYTVRIAGARRPKPSLVRVRTGHVFVANFTIDTGIR